MADGINLILNSDFENGTSNWYIPAPTGGYSGDIVADQYHSGSHCLRFTNTNPSTYYIISSSSAIPVEVGKTYRIGFWSKTNYTNTFSSTGSYCHIYLSYSAGGRWINQASGIIPSTSDWVYTTYDFILPDIGMDHISLGLFWNNQGAGKVATGTAYIDDVTLEIIDPVWLHTAVTENGLIYGNDVNKNTKIKVDIIEAIVSPKSTNIECELVVKNSSDTVVYTTPKIPFDGRSSIETVINAGGYADGRYHIVTNLYLDTGELITEIKKKNKYEDPTFYISDANYSPVNIDTFWTMPWGYDSQNAALHPLTPPIEQRFQTCIDDGYSVLWGEANMNSTDNWEVDMAAASGRKIMMTDYHVYNYAANDPIFQNAVDRYIGLNNDAIQAIYLTDEPHSEFDANGVVTKPVATVFQELTDKIVYIKSRNPNMICYINMMPYFSDASGATYADFIDEFMVTCRPDFISSDYYGQLDTTNPSNSRFDGYFRTLKVMRDKAIQYNVPFAMWILTCPHSSATTGLGYSDINMEQMRWQYYVPITYGSKGILSFVYSYGDQENPVLSGGWNYHNGLINPWHYDTDDGKDPKWYYVQQLNKEMNSMSDVLMKLTSTGVYHYGSYSVPAGYAMALTEDLPFTIETENDVILGTFVHEDDSKWFMVTNFSMDTAASVNIAGNITLTELDKTGSINLIEDTTVELLPGEGRLFEYKPKITHDTGDAPLDILLKIGDFEKCTFSRVQGIDQHGVVPTDNLAIGDGWLVTLRDNYVTDGELSLSDLDGHYFKLVNSSTFDEDGHQYLQEDKSYQYVGLKYQPDTYIKAQFQINFRPTPNYPEYSFRPGDTVVFQMDDIICSNFDDTAVSSVKLILGPEPYAPPSVTSVDLSSGRATNISCEYVVPECKYMWICLEFKLPAKSVDLTPGILFTGAHLWIKRNGEFVQEITETIPYARNRTVNTAKLGWGSETVPYRYMAKNYDHLMVNAWEYPYFHALRELNPDIKIELYQSVCVMEGNGNVRWRLAPVDMAYVDQNHPEWVYPQDNTWTPDVTYNPNIPDSPYVDKYFNIQSIGDKYASDISNPEYQEAWVTGVINKAKEFGVDGVWIDESAGASKRRAGIERGTWETQQFLHYVVPRLRAEGIRVIHMDVLANLDGSLGYLDDVPEVYYNPFWEPTETLTAEMGYRENSPENTPDVFFREYSLLGNDYNYSSSYWLKCINDAKIVKSWNDRLPEQYRKSIYYSVEQQDTTEHPMLNINGKAGWGMFAFASFLLCYNDYVYFDIGQDMFNGHYYEDPGLDYSISKKLGIPDGDDISINSNEYFRYRRYKAEGQDSTGGIVVVNASSDVQHFVMPDDVHDENNKFIPKNSSVKFLPNMGQVFYLASDDSWYPTFDQPTPPESEVKINYLLTETFTYDPNSDVRNYLERMVQTEYSWLTPYAAPAAYWENGYWVLQGYTKPSENNAVDDAWQIYALSFDPDYMYSRIIWDADGYSWQELEINLPADYAAGKYQIGIQRWFSMAQAAGDTFQYYIGDVQMTVANPNASLSVSSYIGGQYFDMTNAELMSTRTHEWVAAEPVTQGFFRFTLSLNKLDTLNATQAVVRFRNPAIYKKLAGESDYDKITIKPKIVKIGMSDYSELDTKYVLEHLDYIIGHNIGQISGLKKAKPSLTTLMYMMDEVNDTDNTAIQLKDIPFEDESIDLYLVAFPDWTPDTTYTVGHMDYVNVYKYHNRAYKLKSSHTATNITPDVDTTHWTTYPEQPFVANQWYNVHSRVIDTTVAGTEYYKKIYRKKNANITGTTPPSQDTTNWERLYPDFDGSKTYKKSDIVLYNEVPYRRKQAGVSATTPDVDTTNWSAWYDVYYKDTTWQNQYHLNKGNPQVAAIYASRAFAKVNNAVVDGWFNDCAGAFPKDDFAALRDFWTTCNRVFHKNHKITAANLNENISNAFISYPDWNYDVDATRLAIQQAWAYYDYADFYAAAQSLPPTRGDDVFDLIYSEASAFTWTNLDAGVNTIQYGKDKWLRALYRMERVNQYNQNNIKKKKFWFTDMTQRDTLENVEKATKFSLATYLLGHNEYTIWGFRALVADGGSGTDYKVHDKIDWEHINKLGQPNGWNVKHDGDDYLRYREYTNGGKRGIVVVNGYEPDDNITWDYTIPYNSVDLDGTMYSVGQQVTLAGADSLILLSYNQYGSGLDIEFIDKTPWLYKGDSIDFSYRVFANNTPVTIKYAIGTSLNGSDIVGWTDIPSGAYTYPYFNYSGDLTNYNSIYVSMRVTDSGGNEAYDSYNIQYIINPSRSEVPSPCNFNIEVVDVNNIKLIWDYFDINPDGFYIQRTMNEGTVWDVREEYYPQIYPFETIAVVDGSARSFVDQAQGNYNISGIEGLSSGFRFYTKYWYRVQAFNRTEIGHKVSCPTPRQWVRTPLLTDNLSNDIKPYDLEVTALSSRQITLHWKSNADKCMPLSVAIYRRKLKNDNTWDNWVSVDLWQVSSKVEEDLLKELSSTNLTYHLDSGLEANTSYQYKVQLCHRIWSKTDIYDAMAIARTPFVYSDIVKTHPQEAGPLPGILSNLQLVQHPRIGLTDERITFVKSEAVKDAGIQYWIDSLISFANNKRDSIDYYINDFLSGGYYRLAVQSGVYIPNEAAAYKMTGDASYAEAAIRYMQTSLYTDVENRVIRQGWFSDDADLQCAYRLYGYLIGYDWLYNYMMQNGYEDLIADLKISIKDALKSHVRFTGWNTKYNLTANLVDSTFSMSNGSDHPFREGDRLFFEATTFPQNMRQGPYYVKLTTDSKKFELQTSFGGGKLILGTSQTPSNLTAVYQLIDPFYVTFFRTSFWNHGLVLLSIDVLAAAVMGDDPDMFEVCENALAGVMMTVKQCITSWGPTAGWDEGGGYGNFHMDYLSLLVEVLQENFGLDILDIIDHRDSKYGNPLKDSMMVGDYINDIPEYFLHMVSEAYSKVRADGTDNSNFNYGDWYAIYVYCRGMYYWIKKYPQSTRGYDNKSIVWFYNRMIETMKNADLWWVPAQTQTLWNLYSVDSQYSPKNQKMPLARTFKSCNYEAAIIKSDWEDKNMAYLGVSAGRGGNHTHVDQSAFIFDANSLRWIIDLPSPVDSSFNTIYWRRYWPLCVHWDHGVMTINDLPPIYSNTVPVEISDNKIKVDMSNSYNITGFKATRLFNFSPEHKSVIVTDDIESEIPIEIGCQLFTSANIGFENNGRTIVLSQPRLDNGQIERYYIHMLSDNGAVWNYENFTPHLPSKYTTAGGNVPTDIKRIFAKQMCNNKTQLKFIITPNFDTTIYQTDMMIPFQERLGKAWSIMGRNKMLNQDNTVSEITYCRDLLTQICNLSNDTYYDNMVKLQSAFRTAEVSLSSTPITTLASMLNTINRICIDNNGYNLREWFNKEPNCMATPEKNYWDDDFRDLWRNLMNEELIVPVCEIEKIEGFWRVRNLNQIKLASYLKVKRVVGSSEITISRIYFYNNGNSFDKLVNVKLTDGSIDLVDKATSVASIDITGGNEGDKIQIWAR